MIADALSVLKVVAITTALGATVNAVIARAADMYPDWFWWAVTVVVAVAVFLWVKHIDDERQAREAARRRAYSEGWYAGFQRRRRMRGAGLR